MPSPMNLEDLDLLADLHARGVLTDEEFQAARRRLVADQPTGPLTLGPTLPGAAAAAEGSPAPGWSDVDPRPAGRADATPEVKASPASPAVADRPDPALAAPYAAAATSDPAIAAAAATPSSTASEPAAEGGPPWATFAAGVALAMVALVAVVGFLWWQHLSAVALVRSGDAALLAGDYARAVEHYEAAQGRWSGVAVLPERLAYAHGGVAELLGEEAISKRELDEAVRTLAVAVRHYTAAEEGYRTSGRGDSIERSGLATRLTAARASEQYARGLLALHEGDPAAAVEYLTAAMGIQSRPEIEAALRRAKARHAFEEGQRLLAEGDLVGAYERFRAAAALENLPEYAAALGLAAEQLTGQAQAALDRGLEALSRGDFSRAAELLAGIPSAAAEAFGAAQGPLAEARERLAQALGGTAPAPAPGEEVAAPANAPEVATLYALHYLSAAGACQAAVEAANPGEMEWTDGWFGRKFPHFEATLKAPGVLTIAGDSLRARDEADGDWRQKSYSCDYDTDAGTVVAVTVE